MTEAGDHGDDRRQHVRLPLRTRIDLAFDRTSRFSSHQTVNISEAGVFVASPKPAAVGTVVKFGLMLGHHGLLRGEAEVVWARQPGESPTLPPGMELRFCRILEGSTDAVADLVAGSTESTAVEHDPATAETVTGSLPVDPRLLEERETEPFGLTTVVLEPEEASGVVADRDDDERAATEDRPVDEEAADGQGEVAGPTVVAESEGPDDGEVFALDESAPRGDEPDVAAEGAAVFDVDGTVAADSAAIQEVLRAAHAAQDEKGGEAAEEGADSGAEPVAEPEAAAEEPCEAPAEATHPDGDSAASAGAGDRPQPPDSTVEPRVASEAPPQATHRRSRWPLLLLALVAAAVLGLVLTPDWRDVALARVSSLLGRGGVDSDAPEHAPPSDGAVAGGGAVVDDISWTASSSETLISIRTSAPLPSSAVHHERVGTAEHRIRIAGITEPFAPWEESHMVPLLDEIEVEHHPQLSPPELHVLLVEGEAPLASVEVGQDGDSVVIRLVAGASDAPARTTPTVTVPEPTATVALEPATSIDEITWTGGDDELVLTVVADGLLTGAQVRHDRLDNPPRLLVRFYGLHRSFSGFEVAEDLPLLARLRVRHFRVLDPPELRLFLDIGDQDVAIQGIKVAGTTATIRVVPRRR